MGNCCCCCCCCDDLCDSNDESDDVISPPSSFNSVYFNNSGVGEFSQITGIALSDAQNLGQLNQVKKIYYKSSEGILIKKYFDNSQAPGHRNLKIVKSFSINRQDHEMTFVNCGYDKQRRLLLWHGTKKANLNGILTHGFHLPTGTGLMFGKGVYFADRVTKSSNYCDQTGSGFLFLCEVALGSMYRTGNPKEYTSAPQKFHSIKGVGKNIPDPNGQTTFNRDIIVPLGKTINNNHPKISFSNLNYNEYIVFNPERILIKFMVKFDWD